LAQGWHKQGLLSQPKSGKAMAVAAIPANAAQAEQMEIAANRDRDDMSSTLEEASWRPMHYGWPDEARSQQVPRWRRALTGALVAAMVVAVATYNWLGRGGGGMLRSSSHTGREVKVANNFQPSCGLIERHIDYGSGDPGDYALDHIPDPQMCCAMCHGIPGCRAWVWKDGNLDGCPFQCWIRAHLPTTRTTAPAGTKVASGVPPPRPMLMLPMEDSEAGSDDAAADEVFMATTAAPTTPAPSTQSPEEQARSLCARENENCFLSKPRCCRNPSHRCYMKNVKWAGCRETCTPGVDPMDPPDAQTPWSCLDRTQDPPLPTGSSEDVWAMQQPSEQASFGQATKGLPKDAGASLFCFMLSQPSGYEPTLIAEQLHLGTSIFACERYAVYSNALFEVAPGVNTHVVDSTLKCEFHEIAWNTWIFIAVWQKVISDQLYRSSDWTVKVDPDATFFPQRLRVVMNDHPNAGYMSNCKYGLHGPIEVLSRRAVDALAADYAASADGKRPEKCVKGNPELGKWGEDMFLDSCLHKILGIQSEPDGRLMCEAHCDCPDWYWCQNGTMRVTYHPFKRVDMYRQCIANAMDGVALT